MDDNPYSSPVERSVGTANQKLTWCLFFFLLSPSIYVYFFRHAWKPRTSGLAEPPPYY